MDNSIQVETFEYKSAQGLESFPIITPKDKTPLSFEEACTALRGDWESQTLGYKIRAMQALATEITSSFGLDDPAKLLIPAQAQPNGSCTAEFLPQLNAVIYRTDSLSADRVSSIIPHEYFHSCQYKLALMVIEDPNLVSSYHYKKLGEWFGQEYINSSSEDSLGYLTQPIEFDTFEFANDFAKKHSLPSTDTEYDFAAAKLAQEKSTQEIVADPKKHLATLSSVVRQDGPSISTFIPGGHIAKSQKMNGMTIYGIRSLRHDETLSANPGLSNILAHLAHKKAPLKVTLMLPHEETDKAMRGHLALLFKDEMFVHPRYVLEDMIPSDITEDKINRLGQSNIVRKKSTVAENLKDAKQKKDTSIHNKRNNLVVPKRTR